MRKYLYYCTLNVILSVFSLGGERLRWRERGTGEREEEFEIDMEMEAGRGDGERDCEIG